MQVMVQTKDDLKKAIENKVDIIIVTGSLANDVIKAQQIEKLGNFALIALGLATSAIVAAIAIAPVTGGGSIVMGIAPVIVAAAPVAAMTGLEIATIIFVCTVGVGTLLAFYKDYDIEISGGGKDGFTARFEKKK